MGFIFFKEITVLKCVFKKTLNVDDSRMLVFIFFIVTFVIQRTSANPHSLQYRYTANTLGTNFPDFTAVGLVDGERFVYYDSGISDLIPKTEWIGKNLAKDYWSSETERIRGDQDDLSDLLKTVMNFFKHSEAVHTLQRLYGCELDDNGAVRGYDQYAYDGEDLISLDLKTQTWTTHDLTAVLTKWKFLKIDYAQGLKIYLEGECIDWLKKYLGYKEETLQRKAPPEVQVFQKQHCSSGLVCLATGFFPSTINLTWQKDGKTVEKHVDVKDTLPNQDGSFQKRIVLKVSSVDLQKHTYTCVIQHRSMEEVFMLPANLQCEKVNDNLPGVIVFAVCLFAVYVLLVANAFYNIWKSGTPAIKNITCVA